MISMNIKYYYCRISIIISSRMISVMNNIINSIMFSIIVAVILLV